MKQKRCKNCRQPFTPDRPLQSVCSPLCARQLAEKKREALVSKQKKEERKADREKREQLKTRSDYIKEAQNAVNAYVRERDKEKGCISCGTSLLVDSVGGCFDAGHYRSRGAAAHLRFDADRNIHGQCKRCNRYLSGNVQDYRVGLIERIGIDAVVSLEADNEPRHWTKEQLIEIRDNYRAKLKALIKQKEQS